MSCVDASRRAASNPHDPSLSKAPDDWSDDYGESNFPGGLSHNDVDSMVGATFFRYLNG